ncbi:hypothetical protein CASFOL_019226 [Castilleja foliolosa]|uniref:ALOG domain-containing protein n=1 Tax=Castilleja foliolosa TaxID=1961234 RepID=A0ABD3D4L1_9LAMI
MMPTINPSGGQGSSSSSARADDHPQPPAQLSRYESQKRRDWNTFGQYLRNVQRPAVALPECTHVHVLDFLRYLDQFGKTKVHLEMCSNFGIYRIGSFGNRNFLSDFHPYLEGCPFFGHPEPVGPCVCPVRQAWGSLDALIGRLRAAYEENGGSPEANPFAIAEIRVYLREVRDSQAKARGIPYKKKKKQKRKMADINDDD